MGWWPTNGAAPPGHRRGRRWTAVLPSLGMRTSSPRPSGPSSHPTSPISTGLSSRSSTSPRSSRGRCSPATRARRSRCAACFSTNSRPATGGGAGRLPGDAAGPAPNSSTSGCFVEYGDDSVAQLGGVHLAVRGRVERPHQGARVGPAHGLPRAVDPLHPLRRPSGRALPLPRSRRADGRRSATGTWRRSIARSRCTRRGSPACATSTRRASRGAEAMPRRVYRSTIRAKALDTLRGLLPAATISNVGIYGTGQALRAAPPPDARAIRWPRCRTAPTLMLRELRKVIPAFLARVDVLERGVRVVARTSPTRGRPSTARARRFLAGVEPEPRDEVTLTDFDPDGEVKVVAAALYAASALARRSAARGRSAARARSERRQVLARLRRQAEQPPARRVARFERTAYRFDVLADYGAFRDLQRHRLLTLEWQRLSPRHGYVDAGGHRRGGGAATDWRRVMDGVGGAARRHRRRRPPGRGRRTPCRWPTACASTWR